MGGTAAAPIQVRGILKNKAAGIYYLCVDEIREIVNVRVGNETLSRAETAATGPGGWGLGVDEAEIDLASFNAAIAAVDAAGLKLDGMLYEQKVARNWITEICRAIRGNYEIGTDGKRRLYIEAPGVSEFLYTEANMELVSAGLGAFDGRVYNKGRLDYFFNPFTGSFMQSAFVTGTIMTESDKVPPPVPVVTVKAFMKTVNVLLSLPSYPADMRGYVVYRHTSNSSGGATQIGSVSAQGATQFADNVDSYGSYYYWAKSVDVWGNHSAFSPVASVTTESLISEDLSATALKMPTGAILSLSAKNCTAESIAEENGVKDVSGHGNHGRAYNGVEI
jgi:hypothetical protein